MNAPPFGRYPHTTHPVGVKVVRGQTRARRLIPRMGAYTIPMKPRRILHFADTVPELSPTYCTLMRFSALSRRRRRC